MEWKKCTEENYPKDDERDLTVIAMPKDDEEGEFYYWLYRECPYGWNVLCRSEAYCLRVEKPDLETNKHEDNETEI